MQFTVGSPQVFLHRVGNTWIDNDGKRGRGGKISQDRHRCELRIGGSRELNRRAKRTLRLRQIIQCHNDLGKHKATRAEPARSLSYESNSSSRYYMFLVVIEEWGRAAARKMPISRPDLSVYKVYVIYRTLMDCYDHAVHLLECFHSDCAQLDVNDDACREMRCGGRLSRELQRRSPCHTAA